MLALVEEQEKRIEELIANPFLTGDEGGEIILRGLVSDIAQNRAEIAKEDQIRLVTQEVVNGIISKLSDQEHSIYVLYSPLHHSLTRELNTNFYRYSDFIASTLAQSFVIQNLQGAELTLNRIAQKPFLMTREDFDEVTRWKTLNNQDEELGFFDLFFHVLRNYLSLRYLPTPSTTEESQAKVDLKPIYALDRAIRAEIFNAPLPESLESQTWENNPIKALLFGLRFFTHYNEETGEDLTPAASKRAGLQRFEKYFPSIYEALEKYLNEHIKETRGLKRNQLYKGLVTVGDLRQRNFFRSDYLLQAEAQDVQDYLREKHGEAKAYLSIMQIEQAGIIIEEQEAPAITPLNNEAYSGDQEESKGITVTPELYSIDALNCLHCFDNRDVTPQDVTVFLLQSIRSVRRLYGFNNMLDTLAEGLGFDFLTALKMEGLERYKENVLALFQETLSLCEYAVGTEEIKRIKRNQIVNEVEPLEKGLDITEGANPDLVQFIQKNKHSTKIINFYEHLYWYIDQEGEI